MRSKEPQKISDTAWYYEERGGLSVIVECRNSKGEMVCQTHEVSIPIRMLRESLSRYPEPKRTAQRAGKVE